MKTPLYPLGNLQSNRDFDAAAESVYFLELLLVKFNIGMQLKPFSCFSYTKRIWNGYTPPKNICTKIP